MRFRAGKRLAYGTQLGGHRGQVGAQAVSCSGRAAALPRHLLCPTQVACCAHAKLPGQMDAQ